MTALHNVSETIKYLPESVSSPSPGEPRRSTSGVHRRVEKVKQSESQRSGGTNPQDSPLPSKEIPGGSRIGVGSLPGRLSEVSVAKLPEERRQENLPSHETDHEILGKTGGVGPLPGGPNESGVALLPEERAHPVDESWFKNKDVSSEGIVSDKPGIEPKSTAATDESQLAQVGAQTYGYDAKPGERGTPAAHAQGLNEPSDKKAQHSDSPHVHRGPGSGPGPSEFSSDRGAPGRAVSQPGTTTLGSTETQGNPITRIPGSEEPSHTSSPSDVEHASAVSEHPAPDTQTVPVTAGRRASTGSSPTREVGFMDRMKGKAKILTGKLGKHEKKVEE